MPPCCCKSGGNNASKGKTSTACLGRCDLPKHRCLQREDVKPGPVPSNMGWLYNAKDSPSHQLRCGWRPGHISCSVLRKIEAQKCGYCGACGPCGPCCAAPSNTRCPQAMASCCKSPIPPTKCLAMFTSTVETSCNAGPCIQPTIRVIRHNGQYSLCTKPSYISNAPSSQNPLKYVLNTEGSDRVSSKTKFSVEGKFNDYQFDYTSSQTSFVLDFTPPDHVC